MTVDLGAALVLYSPAFARAPEALALRGPSGLADRREAPASDAALQPVVSGSPAGADDRGRPARAGSAVEPFEGYDASGWETGDLRKGALVDLYA